jgi:DNA repair exonuclease SbcCD nuclease subunit
MSKILLFSDIHINAHKRSFARLEDCLKALNWVFETAKKHNIQDIVFGGDLFQDRQKIDIQTYNLTFDVLQKHCNGTINFWALLGNHDLWYTDRWDINSILPFSALPNFNLIKEACTLVIAGHNIDFLPFVVNPIEHLKTLSKEKNKLLVAHLAVHGAQLNFLYNTSSDVVLEHDGDMVKVGLELFTSWEQVFLGHYHGEQKIGNIEYIGSPLELTFGEAFQEKHLIIYDLVTGDKEYIKNDFSPRHLIADDDNINTFNVENNFVRLKTSQQTSDLLDLKKDINKKKPASFEIIPKPKIEQSQVVEDAKAIFQKEDEMLEKFVKDCDTGLLDKVKLLEIGKMMCIVEQLNEKS